MISLAEAITGFLVSQPHKVPIDRLRGYASTVDPTLLDDPDARQRIADALNALAEQGVLTLPKARTHWDYRSLPALPKWVTKAGRNKPFVAVAPARVWPQALERAAAVSTRPEELVLLERISAWMRKNPRPVRVPIEERSIDVLGDEKALAVEVTKRLFVTGALTLELLACYPTPLPFASQHVPGVGPTSLLVSENNATYHSLLMAARAQPEAKRPDLHIAWGSGNQFPVSVGSISLLHPAPKAVYYVGDIDLAGLRIAANAASTARSLELPPIRPAAHLYRWLLHHGVVGPDKSNRGPAPDLSRAAAWLPEDIWQPVQSLLLSRQRIAQENLGLAVLREQPNLLRVME